MLEESRVLLSRNHPLGQVSCRALKNTVCFQRFLEKQLGCCYGSGKPLFRGLVENMTVFF